MAHRGGTDVAPGNTVAAFSHAWALGYRYLETDVQATADGVVVVFHDHDLAERTGVGGRVADRTWAELGDLRVDGTEPIPRLDELLDTFANARFNIDPKTDDVVEPLVELLRARSAIDRVGIGSFSDARIRRVRAALGPRVCTSPGPRGVVAAAAAGGLARRLGRAPHGPHGAVQIPVRFGGREIVSAGLVRRFHRLGLQVHVWTVNDETDMRALLDRGVDAIITDRVELLGSVLAERGAWPTGG